jgi:hypothetical protein
LIVTADRKTGVFVMRFYDYLIKYWRSECFPFAVINKTSNANASFALQGAANCDSFGLCWSVPESQTTADKLIISVPVRGLHFAFSDRNFARTKHVAGRY